MLSKRVKFAIGAPRVMGVSKKKSKQILYGMEKIFGVASAFRLTSASDPHKCVVQVFDKKLWNSSRGYRAIVLSEARKELQSQRTMESDE